MGTGDGHEGEQNAEIPLYVDTSEAISGGIEARDVESRVPHSACKVGSRMYKGGERDARLPNSEAGLPWPRLLSRPK